MDMTAEAIKILLDAGKKSAGIVTHMAPSGDTQIVVDPAGNSITLGVPPHPRNHQLGNLLDLIALVKRFTGAGNPEPAVARTISIWCSPASVTAVLDDGDGDRRKHRATLPLIFSEQWKKLLAWQAHRPAMTQKQIIQALRIDLNGCARGDDIKVFRDLVMMVNKDGNAKVEHGKESFGKKVLAEVSGVTSIPDEIVLTIPVYTNPGLDGLADIRCAMEIDPVEGLFWIIPLATSMTWALQERQTMIREQLDAAFKDIESVFIYEGMPTA